MKVTCEYCGHQGTFPDEINRRWLPLGRLPVFACVDIKACDARAEPKELAKESEQQAVRDSQQLRDAWFT